MFMHHYGIPAKCVTLILQMYENYICLVMHNGTLSEIFEVKTGIRQGNILSSLMCILVIDWTLRETVKQSEIAYSGHSLNNRTTSTLQIPTMYHIHINKCKRSRLTQEAKKTGLGINIQKTN